MREYLIDIWIVFVVIVLINSFIFFIKSENRFWKIPIAFFGIFLATMAIVIPIQNRQVRSLDNAYWESAEGKSSGDTEKWEELRKSRKLNVKIRMSLLHFIGLQTIVTFVLQLIGHSKTNKKKTYKWTASVFGLLSLIYLLFQLVIEIVPTGPFF